MRHLELNLIDRNDAEIIDSMYMFADLRTKKSDSEIKLIEKAVSIALPFAIVLFSNINLSASSTIAQSPKSRMFSTLLEYCCFSIIIVAIGCL